MRVSSSDSPSSSDQLRYILVVVLFVALWSSFGLLGKLTPTWSPSAEYYSCMAIVFVWALVLRKRMESANKQLSVLLPSAIIAVLVNVLLVKLNLVGASWSVLLGVFILQIPAIFWRETRDRSIPADV